MAIPTFTPNPAPSPGTQIGQAIALNRSEFADGYAQASPRGLRHIRREMRLTWDALTLVEAITLETFMVERGGYLPFYYTIRGEATARKWTCATWQRIDGAPASFTAILTEIFTNAI